MLNYKAIRVFTWLIAFALAIWLLRDLPFGIIIETIFSLTAAQWFYWTSINLIIIFILAWRWLALTKGFKLKLNLFNLLLLRQAGQSISYITPGPQFGGEPVQIFLLWKKYFITPGDSFLAVASDRLFELWTNFTVLLIGILILIFTQTELTNWVSIAAILTFLIIILSLSIWLLISRSEKIEANINKFTQKWLSNKHLSGINFQSSSFTISLQILLSNKTAIFSALILSLSGWLLTFFELYLVLGFFSINLAISEFVLLIVTMRLAFLLPLPGGIGTLEAAVLWTFTVLTLPISSAAVLLALIRFRDILVLSAGFICLRLLQSKTVAI